MGRAKNSPSRVVAYVRCSTDDQALGPEAQRVALERWCATHGAELVAVHEDRGVSGATAPDQRPALMAALGDLAERSAGVLLVARRDRLARDVVGAAMIERLAERAGGRVVSADGAGEGDTPEAMLMRRVTDAFAEYERAVIRFRTRAALAVKRARGERVGQIPYGYRLAGDGVRLEPDADEQAIIARVRELRSAGLSLDGIARRLNAEGATPRRGRWYHASIHRLVKREGAATA